MPTRKESQYSIQKRREFLVLIQYVTLTCENICHKRFKSTNKCFSSQLHKYIEQKENTYYWRSGVEEVVAVLFPEAV